MKRPVIHQGFCQEIADAHPFPGTGLLPLVAPAIAQAQGQRIIVEQSGAPRQEGLVCIQSSVNLFIAGPTADGEEAEKLPDRARRMVYEMAAHECDLLQEAPAKDCRLEPVTSNLNRQQFGSQQSDGHMVNGSMSLHLTLK
jgi:hypothetical protein